VGSGATARRCGKNWCASPGQDGGWKTSAPNLAVADHDPGLGPRRPGRPPHPKRHPGRHPSAPRRRDRPRPQPDLDRETLTAGSTRKVWWRCPDVTSGPPGSPPGRGAPAARPAPGATRPDRRDPPPPGRRTRPRPQPRRRRRPAHRRVGAAGVVALRRRPPVAGLGRTRTTGGTGCPHCAQRDAIERLRHHRDTRPVGPGSSTPPTHRRPGRPHPQPRCRPRPHHAGSHRTLWWRCPSATAGQTSVNDGPTAPAARLLRLPGGRQLGQGAPGPGCGRCPPLVALRTLPPEEAVGAGGDPLRGRLGGLRVGCKLGGAGGGGCRESGRGGGRSRRGSRCRGSGRFDGGLPAVADGQRHHSVRWEPAVIAVESTPGLRMGRPGGDVWVGVEDAGADRSGVRWWRSRSIWRPVGRVGAAGAACGAGLNRGLPLVAFAAAPPHPPRRPGGEPVDVDRRGCVGVEVRRPGGVRSRRSRPRGPGAGRAAGCPRPAETRAGQT